ESAAKKAQELDDSVAEAHHTLAAIQLFYHWDWNDAEREINRAIELNPSLAESHHIHSYILGAVNRMEEAIQEDKRALELDPFARPWVYGYALIRARRYDEAVKELKQRSEARPESMITYYLLAQAYYCTGDQEKAFEEL